MLGSEVVNCFHFCIFELSKASPGHWFGRAFGLWIAFIFVSLNYQKHLQDDVALSFQSCELLSFLYLWTIKSIVGERLAKSCTVVNCFHFCIFELSKASWSQILPWGEELWIAFIFVSLNYQKHLVHIRTTVAVGCELLSFLYLWTIKSISRAWNARHDTVVNCFHFCIFELSKASTCYRIISFH